MLVKVYRFGRQIAPLVNQDGVEIIIQLVPFKSPIDNKFNTKITRCKNILYPLEVIQHYEK